MSRSPEVAEAIEGVLARSLEAFRSEIAEVVLFGADGTPLRTTYGPGDERVTMAETDREAPRSSRRSSTASTPVVSLSRRSGAPRLRALFEQRGIRHAMVAMLPGENRMIGTIMLANRFGIERGYSPEDLRLLEALANNASVALQYDRLEQAVIKLRSLQEQLHHQAYHDPLTDLPNRSLFMERVKRGARAAATASSRCSSSTSTTSRSSTTRSATPSATRCSSPSRAACGTRSGRRTSSPAWAATSSRSCSPASTTRRLSRAPWRARILRGVRAARCTPATKLVSVHLSVGITDSRRSGDADELIRDADLAMYQAKSKGKSRFEFFEPPMAAAMLRRHDLKEELAKAIEREEIVVEYQPIVSLETGRISAAEALVRWEHPVRGRVPPVGVRPAGRGDRPDPGARTATCSGRRAGRRAAGSVAETTGEPLRVHVNLSVAELRDPDLVPAVLARARGVRLGAGASSSLEITETQLLGDPADSAARFQELRDARRADRARRLRNRLLVAELPALPAARQPQDRQAVRRRAHRRRARGRLHRR